MKEIPLTQGLIAIVDDEDFEFLFGYKWYAALNRKQGYAYAVRGLYENGRRYNVLMHREIMSAKVDQEVDHIDHNTLNNQKQNLRLCSSGQNTTYSKLSRRNKSGFKGVRFIARLGSWSPYIRHNGKHIHLGTFKDPKEAAAVYDSAADKLFGKFALTNKSLNLI